VSGEVSTLLLYYFCDRGTSGSFVFVPSLHHYG
jgi:hypothetical protein